MSFDNQPFLSGKLVAIAPLTADDFQPLYTAASDPAIWAGHPVRDRYRREVFLTYHDFLLQAGGTVVVRERGTQTVIGCSRYYVTPNRPYDIAIGFTFLVRAAWGGQVNFDLKRVMVDHALGHFASVWFDIDPTNIRSQVATSRLGEMHRYDAEIAIGAKPVLWKCYELTAAAWAATCAARDAA